MYPAPARWAVSEPTPLDPRSLQLGDGGGGRADPVSVAESSGWASGACAAPNAQRRSAILADYAVRVAGRPDLLARARAELAGHDLACECPAGLPCHRDILIDFAQPPAGPLAAGGHALAVTAPRPWASLTLLPQSLADNVIHNRSWSTDYRGVLCILAGRRHDWHGVTRLADAGLDADWHAAQTGWLGAAVLVDVHRSRRRCCTAWGAQRRQADQPLYHWVFRYGARLANPVSARGFLGMRAVSWSVLVKPTVLGFSGDSGRRSPGTDAGRTRASAGPR
jgi:hypothetical protein